MQYVVKLGTDVRDWTWFNTFESAARYAAGYGLKAELNLTPPYRY